MTAFKVDQPFTGNWRLPSGTGYVPRPERLDNGVMMKQVVALRRRNVKHYGRDKNPVQQIDRK
jgi:hypothetical protein